MNKLPLLLILISAALPTFGATTPPSGPLGAPGSYAVYKLDANPADRPQYERENGLTVVSAKMQLGPVVKMDAGLFQWYSLTWERINGQNYTMWVLMDGWPEETKSPQVERYIWREPEWPDAVQFMNEITGKPELPRYSLWKYGWPQKSRSKANDIAPVTGFPIILQLQGWPFKRVSHGVEANAAPPMERTIIKLNPDLIIGPMFRYRDTEGGHMSRFDKNEYDFVENDKEDFFKDLASGMNLHEATKPTPNWMWRTNCYVARPYYVFDDWPAHLYRSNFWGRQTHVDEPGVHFQYQLSSDKSLANITPAEAAKRLEAMALAPIYAKTGNMNYSVYWMNDFIDRQFGRGNLDFSSELNYPVWEAAWQDIWYELAPEGSACGMVDEDIYPESLVESYNIEFGSQIPATIENACEIKIAVTRGACRNFNKNWGTAIYSYSPGALNPKIDVAALKYMYDAGATYFWYWNGWPNASTAHVPYPYRRAYSDWIRQSFKANPNRDMQALLHAAKTCIVIPYGYTFAPNPLMRLSWLYLDRENEKGVTYRQVLSNAAIEAERLIRDGVKFDIAVDDPRFKPVGYDELIYVQEDGTLRVVRPGKKDEILKTARTPERPDIGPMPKIEVSYELKSATLPCKVELKATATSQAGEFAVGLQPIDDPLVMWNVLTPEGEFESLQYWGPDASFEAATPGIYKLRAGTADCFGRPVAVNIEIEIPGASN